MIKTICCAADFQGYANDIPPEDMPDADLLAIAGDLTTFGTYQELGAFDNWLGKIKDKYRYITIVGGNHDLGLARDINGHTFFNNCIYLQDELVELEGLKIYGSPVNECGQFAHDWEFCDKPYIKKAVAAIPEDIDVLITHGPPFGLLDLTPRGERIGCKPLKSILGIRTRPRLLICGHAHSSYGIEYFEKNMLVVNAALADERNVLVSPQGHLYKQPHLISTASWEYSRKQSRAEEAIHNKIASEDYNYRH